MPIHVSLIIFCKLDHLNNLLAMMHYKDAFEKASEEIAGVIGTERLPTFHNRASSVYPNLWHNY
jgi:hypothetical protein